MSGDGMLRWYDDGVYREGGEDAVGYLAQRLLRGKANTTRINEVLAHVRRVESVRPLSIDPDAIDVIRARNGILNLRDWSLTEYTPATTTVVQIPWELKDASCPGIHAFLMEIFEGDLATVQLVYEVAGYLCLSRNALRKAVLLYGSGNNGKSILLHLFKCLLGANNVAAVPLQRLGGDDPVASRRQAREHLRRRRAEQRPRHEPVQADHRRRPDLRRTQGPRRLHLPQRCDAGLQRERVSPLA